MMRPKHPESVTRTAAPATKTDSRLLASIIGPQRSCLSMATSVVSNATHFKPISRM